MFKQKIRDWKLRRDDNRDNAIKQHLRDYWFKFRRHDLLINVMLESDFSNEELVELSNLLGQVAHDRERTLSD